MEPFRRHRGRIAVVDRANIDTDQIIPKQYLKSIRRTGFEEGFMRDWRFLPDGSLNPEFELNQPRFQGASILVAGNNFGCGSSREHAVWAVMQYGFRVVIAPWSEENGERTPAFADIFRNNSVKNGLLTIELSPQEVEQIKTAVADHPGLEATVDLEEQTIILHTGGSPEPQIPFEVDPAVRRQLLDGLDEIGLTLEHEADIAAFERQHDPQRYGPR